MRALILCIAAVGILLFGGALVISFTHPLLVERQLAHIVRAEVEDRIDAKLHSMRGSYLRGWGDKTLEDTEAESADQMHELRVRISGVVSKVMTDMLDVDCECRRRTIVEGGRHVLEQSELLRSPQARMHDLVEGTYKQVTANLLREFRIFTSANAAFFLLLLGVAYRLRRAALQLLLPATVLLGSAMITAAIYWYGQDWLQTIVFGEYVGYAYFAYLGMAVALLSDIAFNRARVCTWLINAMGSVVGTAIQATPC